jgi:hypothetical protein
VERLDPAGQYSLLHDLVVRLAGKHHAPVECRGEPQVVRIERLGVQHDRDGVQLLGPFQQLEVVGEGEVRGHDQVGLFALEVADELREHRDAEDLVEQLDHEGIVDTAVERVDERRVAQRVVPVELVQVAQEARPQRNAEVHDVHIEVFAALDVELFLERHCGCDVPAADVDRVDVNALHQYKSVDSPPERVNLCTRGRSGTSQRPSRAGLAARGLDNADTRADTSKRKL